MAKHKQTPKGIIRVRTKDIPKRVRNIVPRAFKDLDAWPDAVALMADDDIGVGESIILPVPGDVLSTYPNLRAFARQFVTFCKKHYNRKYKVDAKKLHGHGPSIIITQLAPH